MVSPDREELQVTASGSTAEITVVEQVATIISPASEAPSGEPEGPAPPAVPEMTVTEAFFNPGVKYFFVIC